MEHQDSSVCRECSNGTAHDAPEGRALLGELGPMPEGLSLLMDRAYEGDETRQVVLELGLVPAFLPNPTALNLGNTTAFSTRSATKSSACSGGSKASAVSSPASRNSTSSSWHSYTLP
jgi:hypothetical protein